MKSVWFVFLLLVSAISFASDYPSPTGWRGPTREAGRPWLEGTPYQPRTTLRRAAPTVTWYQGETGDYVWSLDRNAGLYWYYFPATGQYSYRAAR